MIEVHHVVFLNLLLYLLILLLARKGVAKVFVDKSSFRVLIVVFLLFCLYPAWSGDYFHYRESFPLIKKGWLSHMENVYVFIIENIVASYFQLRLVVWGTAILALYYSYKNLNINCYLAFTIFAVMFVHRFSYARVSLAMALSFLGLSLILSSKKHYNFIFGAVFLISSLFFHKTALFGVSIILVSLIVFNFLEKITMIIILCCFPLLLIAAQTFLNDFISLNILDYEAIINIEKGQDYLSREALSKGLATRLDTILMNCAYLSIVVEYLLFHFKKKYSSLPTAIKVFATASFLTIVIASLFAFDLGFTTDVIYERFIYFSMIPSAAFISYCIEIGCFKKWTKITIIFNVFSVMYSLLYSLYLAPNSPYTW